jgi:hypothetical protein
MQLTFHVANSLTGRITGRLNPHDWEWTDPLTGSATGKLSVPIPVGDVGKIEQLVAITRPHITQVAVKDELGRWLFGGPILADPTKNGNVLDIPIVDWRAWFYAAPLRPVGGTRVEYVRVAAGTGGQVEQNEAMAAIATLGLTTVGAPRMVVDTIVPSGVMRDVTARMFTMSGAALDNVARRFNGPDWWTYMDVDPADPRYVVAHLAVAWPERTITSGVGLALRKEVVLETKPGSGGNIIDYDWPQQSTPPSRVHGVSSDPAPDETWAAAEDPALLSGEALAWDEVWQLPEGVTTATSAFDHSLGRLEALSGDFGVTSVNIRPEATDIGSWGPGDRCRLTIRDGWRDIELDSARILSRTLKGRGPHVTSVSAQVNLGVTEVEPVDPTEEVE